MGGREEGESCGVRDGGRKGGGQERVGGIALSEGEGPEVGGDGWVCLLAPC